MEEDQDFVITSILHDKVKRSREKIFTLNIAGTHILRKNYL
jgi:hypothetical protein